MKGLTIMLATAAAAKSLVRRATSLPRAPMLWKNLALRPAAGLLPPTRLAQKPRATEAAAAAAVAVVAAETAGWFNRRAAGGGNLFVAGYERRVDGLRDKIKKRGRLIYGRQYYK